MHCKLNPFRVPSPEGAVFSQPGVPTPGKRARHAVRPTMFRFSFQADRRSPSPDSATVPFYAACSATANVGTATVPNQPYLA